MASFKTVSTDGVISGTGLGQFKGFVVSNTHATEAGSVILYDNASAASGNVIAQVAVLAGTTETLYVPGGGVNYSNGIYADVSALGTMSVSVYFE